MENYIKMYIALCPIFIHICILDVFIRIFFPGGRHFFNCGILNHRCVLVYVVSNSLKGKDFHLQKSNVSIPHHFNHHSKVMRNKWFYCIILFLILCTFIIITVLWNEIKRKLHICFNSLGNWTGKKIVKNRLFVDFTIRLFKKIIKLR